MPQDWNKDGPGARPERAAPGSAVAPLVVFTSVVMHGGPSCEFGASSLAEWL